VLIGFLQFRPEHRNVEANLDHVSRALGSTQADLVVLPEMCMAGYLFGSRKDLARYAEPVPDGPSCQVVGRLCRARSLNVVFGMAETHGGRIFNSAVLATAGGQFHVYRKAHLFVDEKDTFDRGDSPFPVFSINSPSSFGRRVEGEGVKVGMLVCFDHFFPEAARSLALAGAQIICHPSNLVLDAAQKTTLARAIENRVFWVLANRIGTETLGDKSLSFTGRSQIVAPDGKLLAQAGPDSEELQVVDVNPAEAMDKKATPRNDLLADRRTDLYRI